MRSPTSTEPRFPRLFATGIVVLLCFALGAPAGADDKEEPAAEKAGDGLMEATDEQARKLAGDLKKAAKAKKLKEIRPALEAIDGLKHESFEKPLLKMMTHKIGEVALEATDLLAPRVDEKGLGKMWKYAFSNKANSGRYAVRARVVRAYGEKGIELDKGEYKELERDWRWMFGNPQPQFAGPAEDLIKYFALTKDKRHCRKLAEQIDEPNATSPNSPTNPPAAWWERKWKMWQPLLAPLVEALKAITGQEFDSTEQAKAWFEANEKDFGFDW